MNPEAFCYLGLLRFPEQLEASVALLPKLERQQVAKVLAELKDLPQSELIARWGRQRELEYVEMRRAAYERSRVNLDQLTPTVGRLCTWWLSNFHE